MNEGATNVHTLRDTSSAYAGGEQRAPALSAACVDVGGAPAPALAPPNDAAVSERPSQTTSRAPRHTVTLAVER